MFTSQPRLSALVGIAIGTAACGVAQGPEPGASAGASFTASEAILISRASAILAEAADIRLHPAGLLYIVDQRDARVLEVTDAGAVARTFGRPGPGPGEMARPVAVGFDAEKLRVFDFEARAIHLFALEDGAYLKTIGLPYASIPTRVDFDTQGKMALSGLALPATHQSYLGIVTADGSSMRTYGSLDGDQSRGPASVREDALRGQFSPLLEAQVLPIFADDGTVWTIQQTTGRVRAFAMDGDMTDDFYLELPELAAAKEAFFGWYRASGDRIANRVFESVEDAQVDARGRLWLLWNMPRDGSPPTLTVHTPEGALLWRFLLGTGRDEGDSPASGSIAVPPRRQFALDERRRRVFLTDGAELAVYELHEPFLR